MHALRLMLAVGLVAVAACGGGNSSATTTSTAASTSSSAATTGTTTSVLKITTIAPPTGIAAPNAQWLQVTRPDGMVQLVAVYRPEGTQPHPVVVFFHGSGGLAGIQLAWAQTLSQHGYVVVAGCYLDVNASAPPGVFLPCPGLPDVTQQTPENVLPPYTTLLDVAVGLDGVDSKSVGVVGVSLGANVVLSGDDTRVKAIVADSGFRTTPGTTAGPILLLGFDNDPNVPHASLVAFEQAQQSTNPVDSHYYSGTSHVTILSPDTADDATARIVAFLEQHLG
jgi:dienelactone hydrolase